MIAALPMYDFAGTAGALDAVWEYIGARLRAAGVDAPLRLTRVSDLAAQWRDPGLLLGQTCGYPYRRSLKDVVEIIATPKFGFEGCEGADHCSFLIVRRDDPRAKLSDFRGARAAINARDSNTGMNLFRAAVAPQARDGRFFGEVIVTGAHAASLAAITAGEADIAAVDCVSFGLIARFDPAAVSDIRILARTPASPGLPFIASRGLPPEVRAATRVALLAALAAPRLRAAWKTLGIVGAAVMSTNEYERIDKIEAEAIALGLRQFC
jgi:ABC-type phosphate/phosphonate transport system substrate-binding protein